MSYGLLIDDDESVRESVARVAAEEDLELTTAASWEEGVGVFLSEAPLVVVCDYNLPGSRLGLKLLRELATLRASARLVLFSAYLNDDDVAAIERLQLADRVVRKTRPIQTANVVLEELRAARDRAAVPTDWHAFGTSNVRWEAADSHALDQLDAFLRSNRLPDGGGKQ